MNASAALAELLETTVGAKGHTAAWWAKDTHWSRGKKELDKLWAVDLPRGNIALSDGLGKSPTGRFYRPVVGSDVGGLQIQNYTDYGLGFQSNQPLQAATTPYHVHDCIIRNIGRGGTSDGTAEAGIWAGFEGLYERILIQNVWWSSLWTGGKCRNSTFRHISIRDAVHVPVYLEHSTINSLFEYIEIERAEYTGNGFNTEWTYGGTGSYGNTFRYIDQYVPKDRWAFFLDAGPYDNKHSHIRLWGPGNGFAHPRNVVDPSKPNLFDWDTIDMTDLKGTKEWIHDDVIGVSRLAAQRKLLTSGR